MCTDQNVIVRIAVMFWSLASLRAAELLLAQCVKMVRWEESVKPWDSVPISVHVQTARSGVLV